MTAVRTIIRPHDNQPATATPILRAVCGALTVFLLFVNSCTPPMQTVPVLSQSTEAPSTTKPESIAKDTATITTDSSTVHLASDTGLSDAAQLLVKACNNYLSVNPASPKTPEVYTIKASIFFNNRRYDSARTVYKKIIEYDKTSPQAFDAIRMIAQAYYEEKKFSKAQVWFKKLSDAVPEGADKSEALARIAESIFRLAEVYESEKRYQEAAEQYERVALEYPQSKIADISLFNAGLSYEKRAEWSRSILVFQRLVKKFHESELVPKTYFRIAKCHEKMSQWDLAAETYLYLVTIYPTSELAPTALYNAGFSFENAEKMNEAAATFEKLVELYPDNEDAADVLFRAGELYGKLKKWEAVSRVTQEFSRRFGNDESRIVQALCMAGIALYMRNRNDEAIDQLENAVRVFKKLRDPGPMNTYYAAKALYTVGEIHHTVMNSIVLKQPRTIYKKLLSEKSDLLDRAIDAYADVIRFNLSDWTTRAIFQIGQIYEDFAIGIFSQERPDYVSMDQQLAFELSIAQAVEKYFIGKSLKFHERNVKLGIKEKIEDKFILQSRQKLTYLPYLAAENYLALVTISQNSPQQENISGFALIARKLQLLQEMAPFQERAIELFLRCLELGTTYQEQNEFYTKASTSITGISFSVGETYADVIRIAREAPIPEGFDNYERFVYKTKLLKQIEGYEDQALENYLKTIKIEEAYKLQDSTVARAKEGIAHLLFNRGRCYDLLCTNAFTQPPFPEGIDEAEKEEYMVRFEEIGLRFQEQAFDIYKNILNLADQSYAKGDYVTHAYVRLYQNFPDDYGVKEQQMVQKSLSSGSRWKVTADSIPDWHSFTFNDSSWAVAQRAPVETKDIAGFPNNTPVPMWYGTGNPDSTADYTPFSTVYFRRTFSITAMPHTAQFYLAAKGEMTASINDKSLGTDTAETFPDSATVFDCMGKLRIGNNVIAIRIHSDSTLHQNGLFPLLLMTIGTDLAMPKPPGYDASMTLEDVRNDKYVFPEIKNFSLEQIEVTP